MRYPQPDMTHSAVRLHRWDEIALEKVTEMLSRKIVSGDREMLVQSYVKRGCLVPMHAHDSEQMTYVLHGALKFVVGGEEITVRKARCCTSRPGLSTRPKRSRIRSSWTCSVPCDRDG
jgi:quercetin dioxygenase-like cupin family protein